MLFTFLRNLIWIVQKQDFGDELEDTCKMNKKELKHKKIVCEGGKGETKSVSSHSMGAKLQG